MNRRSSVSAPPDKLAQRVREYTAAAAICLSVYVGTLAALKFCLALGWSA